VNTSTVNQVHFFPGKPLALAVKSWLSWRWCGGVVVLKTGSRYPTTMSYCQLLTANVLQPGSKQLNPWWRFPPICEYLHTQPGQSGPFESWQAIGTGGEVLAVLAVVWWCGGVVVFKIGSRYPTTMSYCQMIAANVLQPGKQLNPWWRCPPICEYLHSQPGPFFPW
jgi:hypothetical protein